MSTAEARYVEAIAQLASAGEPAAVSALARLLGRRPPSVTEMLNRLAADGLIVRDGSGAATLTAKGADYAAELADRRALAARFLAEVLSVPADQLDAETDRLAPTLSPRLVQRMRAVLERRWAA